MLWLEVVTEIHPPICFLVLASLLAYKVSLCYSYCVFQNIAATANGRNVRARAFLFEL